MTCTHDWQRELRPNTHFKDEPNSKIRHKLITPLICVACGQRGFRYQGYPGRRVVYTWDKNPANWLTEDAS